MISMTTMHVLETQNSKIIKIIPKITNVADKSIINEAFNKIIY